MLTRSHVTDDIYPLGTVTDEHVAAARSYVMSFRDKALRPFVRSSSSSWLGVLRRFPNHLGEARRLIAQARHDAGNDFSRYPLPTLARIYLRKKINLLQANLWLRLHDSPTRRPYVYFGLHRQPESSVDVLGAFFSDQLNLVRTIARSIPVGYDLLVKLHISDADGWPLRFYRQLEAIPSVRLIDSATDSRTLLMGAALTVTNSGTMAFEAGLLCRPAITFSRVHFNELPTVRFCDQPPRLPELIDEMLARPASPGDDAAVVEFMSRMFAWSFAGMPNRGVFDTGLTDADLASLVGAYQRLFDAYAPLRPHARPR